MAAETERPPVLHNRDSLLPPKVIKNVENSSVKSKSALLEKESFISDIKDRSFQQQYSTKNDHPSLDSLKESTELGRDTASTKQFSQSALAVKSKSFLNKQALKKLIFDKTQATKNNTQNSITTQSEVKDSESVEDPKNKKQAENTGTADVLVKSFVTNEPHHASSKQSCELKNESLRKLNKDLNDYFD